MTHALPFLEFIKSATSRFRARLGSWCEISQACPIRTTTTPIVSICIFIRLNSGNLIFSVYVRTARWTGDNPRSAKAPNRSLAAMRAEAASRVTTKKMKGSQKEGKTVRSIPTQRAHSKGVLGVDRCLLAVIDNVKFAERERERDHFGDAAFSSVVLHVRRTTSTPTNLSNPSTN